MRRRFLGRSVRLATASFVASGALLVAAPAPYACAGEGPEAALVIDTGSSVLRLCVALDASSVSGLRVIELAAQQHGLSYSFGYQGQAVCMLAGVGSEEEECFQGGQPFWGYWRGESSGGWSWSGTGAGGSRVEDGDVEGWAWGTGNDGGSHPAPPVTSQASVCGVDEKPRDRGEGEDGDSTGGGQPVEKQKESRPREQVPDDRGAPGTVAPAEVDDEPADGESGARQTKKRKEESSKERRGERKDGASGTPVVTSSTPSEGAPPAAATGTSDSDGPPDAGLVALLLTIGLALAGAWFLKRRQMPSR